VTDVEREKASLEDKLKTHETRLAAESEEFRRLSKLKRHDIYDHTSISTMMEVSKSTIAAPPENLAGRAFGDTEAAERQRRQDDLEAILKGEPMAVRPDVNVLLDACNRRAQAEEAAVVFLKKQIAAENFKLSSERCKALKPIEAEMMKKLYKLLAEVHAVHSEIHDKKESLIGSGIGLIGIFLNTPDFLGNPRDKQSDLAQFFRNGVTNGFISVVPGDLRL
jgi:hypothetical protein